MTEMNSEVEYANIEEDREALITAVKARRLLYDISSNSNRNKHLKELAWTEISNELQKQDLWCRNEWKKLKDSYAKKKKSLVGKTGQARKKIEAWCHFASMQFLNDHAVQATTSGNMPSTDPGFGEDEILNESFQPDIDTGSQAESGQSDSTYSSQRNKRKVDPVDQEIINYLKKPKESVDEHHHFGMAIAQQLRDMHPAVSSGVKIKIQQLVHETLFPVTSFELSDLETE